MAYVYYQNNPCGYKTDDCVVRAIAKVTGRKWHETYMDIALQGLSMCQMPSNGAVWGTYLKSKGYDRYVIPSDCPDCYTVKDFCRDNPKGRFVLCISGLIGHIVAVIDGDYYDTTDTGNEIPTFFYVKGDYYA